MTDKIDLSPEAVGRYAPETAEDWRGMCGGIYARMRRETNGDWVRFTDYEALAARLAEVEALRADRVKGQKDYCALMERHDAIAAELAAAKQREVGLRKERDVLKAQKWDVQHTDTINDFVSLGMERDRLAAELAAAQQREAGLADFIAEFAAAKIDALRYQPAYGESPEDEPDPVVEAATVWAWQADAKAALSHNGRSGLPVPNVSLGWPLEDDVGSIIVGKVSSHNGRGE